MNKNIIAICASVMVAIVGCTQTPTFQTGPDAEVTHDNLTRLDRTIMDAVWARTDIDLSGFTKVKFLGVGVQYRNADGRPYSGRAGQGTTQMRRSSGSEFQLDEETRALFEQEIAAAFLEEIQRSETIVVTDEIAEDVLLVRGGLLDVVSRVPPEAVGRSRIWITSIGEATLILEIVDPMSNTVLARAVDRRAGDRVGGFESNRVTNRAEVRRLGQAWGRIVREGLEAMLADGLAGS